LVLVFVGSMMLPDNWHEQIRFGGVPLGAVALAAICFGLIVRLLRKPAAVRLIVWLGLLALVATSVGGYLRGNIDAYSLKFYVADIFSFSAALAGYVLPRTQTGEETDQLVSRICIVASVGIFATYLALLAGLVSTSFAIQDRTFTLSIFYAAGILLILLPWTTVSDEGRHSSTGSRTLLLFAIALGTGLLSATRSVIIEVIVAAAFYLIVKRRRFDVGFVMRLVGGVTVLILPLFSGLFSTFVFQRLGNTQLGDELRYAELEMWWSQTKADILLGQGMGSRFISNVIQADGNSLASNPHVGIVTTLMKGGVLLFLGFVVIPALVAVYILFSPGYEENRRGAAASVLMFIVLACLSGGWEPLQMFAYGLAVSAMTLQRKGLRTGRGSTVASYRQSAFVNQVPSSP
jgi:hypothetical protein